MFLHVFVSETRISGKNICQGRTTWLVAGVTGGIFHASAFANKTFHQQTILMRINRVEKNNFQKIASSSICAKIMAWSSTRKYRQLNCHLSAQTSLLRADTQHNVGDCPYYEPECTSCKGKVYRMVSAEHRKTTTKWLWPVTKDTDNLVYQSQLDGDACSWREARENMCERVTTTCYLLAPPGASWHIGPLQRSSTFFGLLRSSAFPPMSSTLPLSVPFLLFVFTLSWAFPFSFSLLVPSLLQCYNHYCDLASGCDQSVSIYDTSLPHSAVSCSLFPTVSESRLVFGFTTVGMTNWRELSVISQSRSVLMQNLKCKNFRTVI